MRRKNKRLYGKRATKEQIMEEVVRLLLGTEHDDPLTVADTATTLGYARDTIYQYITMAVKGGLLKRIHDKLVIPTNQKTGIRAFKRFNKILVSQKQTEKALKNYAQLYLEGRAERDPRGMKSPTDIKNVIYHRAQAIRDFCGFHGITWRRGTTGIMSQSVPNHGKYADVRLTDDELDEADRFIRERWGIDSDVYRWFWIGIESCARFNALYLMKLEYTKHTSRKEKTRLELEKPYIETKKV